MQSNNRKFIDWCDRNNRPMSQNSLYLFLDEINEDEVVYLFIDRNDGDDFSIHHGCLEFDSRISAISSLDKIIENKAHSTKDGLTNFRFTVSNACERGHTFYGEGLKDGWQSLGIK